MHLDVASKREWRLVGQERSDHREHEHREDAAGPDQELGVAERDVYEVEAAATLGRGRERRRRLAGSSDDLRP